MKVEIDEKYKVMYVQFNHPDAGKNYSVKRTIADYWPGVHLDIGHDEKPIGLEFMNIERVEGLYVSAPQG